MLTTKRSYFNNYITQQGSKGTGKKKEEKVEEKEKGDPKEDMKKEKAPTTSGNMITTPFNDAKVKRHIRGHLRLENIPPKEN